jgi:hypothetical protein
VKVVGYVWGIGGILLLLLFAIMRLGPIALELSSLNLRLVHWLALLFSVSYMLYAEGYKGFHLGFAPRVVARAHYLSRNPRPLHLLLAPLFCMGYIYATRRRQILSLGLTTMIICFVLLVRMLPQPWRGIVDAGVVAGLMLGVASICYFLLSLWRSPETFEFATDIPASADQGIAAEGGSSR